jgi:hypothetical protein
MRSTPTGFAGVCAVTAVLVAAPICTDRPAAADRQQVAPAAPQPPAAQPAPTAGTPQGQGRGQGQGQGQGQPQARGQASGRGPRGAAPLNFEDRTGFQPIFDGASMKNWDGDPRYWRAENGALVGETTAANKLTENTFAIWRGGEPADFELKLEYRMSATNSGIQFRSVQVPVGEGRPPVTGRWAMKGYQADIDFENQFTGMIYEERGRGFLMQRGQAIEIGPDGVSRMIASLEGHADELKALIKPGDWNTVHLIARGNTILNIVNGHVTAFIVDDDVKGRALNGFIGLQLHVGAPMKIEFRNIYLKKL